MRGPWYLAVAQSHLADSQKRTSPRGVWAARASSLRKGDIIRFRAEKSDGALVITDVVRR